MEDSINKFVVTSIVIIFNTKNKYKCSQRSKMHFTFQNIIVIIIKRIKSQKREVQYG